MKHNNNNGMYKELPISKLSKIILRSNHSLIVRDGTSRVFCNSLTPIAKIKKIASGKYIKWKQK